MKSHRRNVYALAIAAMLVPPTLLADGLEIGSGEVEFTPGGTIELGGTTGLSLGTDGVFVEQIDSNGSIDIEQTRSSGSTSASSGSPDLRAYVRQEGQSSPGASATIRQSGSGVGAVLLNQKGSYSASITQTVSSLGLTPTTEAISVDSAFGGTLNRAVRHVIAVSQGDASYLSRPDLGVETGGDGSVVTVFGSGIKSVARIVQVGADNTLDASVGLGVNVSLEQAGDGNRLSATAGGQPGVQGNDGFLVRAEQYGDANDLMLNGYGGYQGGAIASYQWGSGNVASAALLNYGYGGGASILQGYRSHAWVNGQAVSGGEPTPDTKSAFNTASIDQYITVGSSALIQQNGSGNTASILQDNAQAVFVLQEGEDQFASVVQEDAPNSRIDLLQEFSPGAVIDIQQAGIAGAAQMSIAQQFSPGASIVIVQN